MEYPQVLKISARKNAHVQIEVTEAEKLVRSINMETNDLLLCAELALKVSEGPLGTCRKNNNQNKSLWFIPSVTKYRISLGSLMNEQFRSLSTVVTRLLFTTLTNMMSMAIMANYVSWWFDFRGISHDLQYDHISFFFSVKNMCVATLWHFYRKVHQDKSALHWVLTVHGTEACVWMKFSCWPC